MGNEWYVRVFLLTSWRTLPEERSAEGGRHLGKLPPCHRTPYSWGPDSHLLTQGRAHGLPPAILQEDLTSPRPESTAAAAVKAKLGCYFPSVKGLLLGTKNPHFLRNIIRLKIMHLCFYNEKPGLGKEPEI